MNEDDINNGMEHNGEEERFIWYMHNGVNQRDWTRATVLHAVKVAQEHHANVIKIRYEGIVGSFNVTKNHWKTVWAICAWLNGLPKFDECADGSCRI